MEYGERAGGRTFTDYPTEAGACTLRVKADDQPNERWTEEAIHGHDMPGVGLVIRLRNHPNDRLEDVPFLRHNVCETETFDRSIVYIYRFDSASYQKRE